jgi:hypothetical protein
VRVVKAKHRIIIHCTLVDKQRCKRIANKINGTKYDVELNGKLRYSWCDIETHYIVCCLSSNYENDSKRQGELEYAFKSQYHIIPIRIKSDFKPQQLWLQHILESRMTSVIGFSESKSTLSNACNQLLLELFMYENRDDATIITASTYVNIYQECGKHGWYAVPKLLLHMHDNLLNLAIDKGTLADMAKMIDLMHTLNNQCKGQAQAHIDLFHKWLTRMTQAKRNNESHGPNQQQKPPQKFQDQRIQNELKEVKYSFICLYFRFMKELVHF